MDMMRDVMTKMTHLCHEIKMKDEQSAAMTKIIDNQNIKINGMTREIDNFKQNATVLAQEYSLNAQKYNEENQLLQKKMNEMESKTTCLTRELNLYKDYVKSAQITKEQTDNKLKSLEDEYNDMKNNHLVMANEYETDAKQLKETIESKQLMIKALQTAKDKSKNELMVSERENKRLKETIATLQQNLKQTENANIDKDVKCEELKQMNDELNAINNELSEKIARHSNELNEMKMKCENDAKTKVTSNKELSALNKSLDYYKKENETNKRRLLAFKFNHLAQEKLVKANPIRIGDEQQKIGSEVIVALKNDIMNTIDIRYQQLCSGNSNAIKRVMTETEEQINVNRKRAKRLVHKLSDGRVLCAICDNVYKDTGIMQRHLNMKHMIVLNNNFDDVEFDPKLIPATSQYEALIID